ncbi:MAG: Omp28 family outer membrane lipoprotein [Cryomorphaceae bacterium]|nr:Omp28 family outer membrane lipoprotein [Cryomorphaceae bacterium]
MVDTLLFDYLMRKQFFTYLLLVFGVLFISSCDYIDEPIRQGGNGGTGGGGGETEEAVQRVLIEKFTGHRCNNCPNAEGSSTQIKNSFGEKIVIVSYHVLDNFAGPTNNLPQDWRTPEGTSIFNFYRFFGIPIGMVNRLNYTSNGTGHMKQHGGWASHVQSELNNDPLFDIRIETEWSNSSRNAKVDVDIEALENYSEEVLLSVFVIENNIIAPQILPSYDIDEEYVHNYMFRQSITHHLGDDIGTNVWARGTIENYNNSDQLGSDIEPSNVYIVAFIRNKSNHKIVQVAQKKLM